MTKAAEAAQVLCDLGPHLQLVPALVSTDVELQTRRSPCGSRPINLRSWALAIVRARRVRRKSAC